MMTTLRTLRKAPLVLAGGLWLAILAGFHFVLPVFGAMYSDFGSRLPLATQVLVDCAAFFRNYPIMTALAALGVMLAGAEIDRRNSAVGVHVYFAASVLAVLAVIGAMLSPVFQLAAVAGRLQQ